MYYKPFSRWRVLLQDFFTNTKAKESLKKRVTQEGDSCAAVTAMLFLTLYCLLSGIFVLFISHFWVYDVFFSNLF